MLLGHDPVAYFAQGKPVRGDPALQSTLPGRTYYFANADHKRRFDAAPSQFEPQYAGFCASGAAFGIKLGSDPTEWRIVDGRLFIFGDVMGRTAWELDPAWNIRHGDALWPEAKEAGWRAQSLWRYANKVPWYQTGADIRRAYEAQYPGKAWPVYDVGGMLTNLLVKSPGWRAREGFGGQPAVGLVGEDACPPACAGQPSRAFGQ
jgi:YHS domain-containing protein